MTLEEYIKVIEKRTCHCVQCSDCHGFGTIDDPMDYSGRYPETCWSCNGSGLEDFVCERCDELEDLYAQLEEIA